jgi:hypothetical protein
MSNKEFKAKVNEICNFIKTQPKFDHALDIDDRLKYSYQCEAAFDKNLRSDYRRLSTFIFDISLAESYELDDLSKTLSKIINSCKNDIKLFAELILVLNHKAWQHDYIGTYHYSMLYSQLYYMVKELYFEWYEGKPKTKYDEAIDYYMKYID